MDGPTAVPRRNGELVFEEPWEGRVFGMAVALHGSHVYGWEEFQRQLIAQIAEAESRGKDSRYYERWLASFERLLEDKGLVTPEELQDRTEAFEFGFLLRIAAEVVLYLGPDLIFRLILKSGVEPVHVRVSQQVCRERVRDTGRNAGRVSC